MSRTKQVDGEDIMFIAGETEHVYQHVCMLAPLDVAGSPAFDFDVFRRHCEKRIAQIPQFHWKLHRVPMGVDRPYWVADERFNFDHHIKRIALPGPGDAAELCEVASHL